MENKPFLSGEQAVQSDAATRNQLCPSRLLSSVTIPCPEPAGPQLLFLPGFSSMSGVSCMQTKNQPNQKTLQEFRYFNYCSLCGETWNASFLWQESGITSEVNTGIEEQDWFGKNLPSLQHAGIRYKKYFLLLSVLIAKAIEKLILAEHDTAPS